MLTELEVDQVAKILGKTREQVLERQELARRWAEPVPPEEAEEEPTMLEYDESIGELGPDHFERVFYSEISMAYGAHRIMDMAWCAKWGYLTTQGIDIGPNGVQVGLPCVVVSKCSRDYGRLAYVRAASFSGNICILHFVGGLEEWPMAITEIEGVMDDVARMSQLDRGLWDRLYQGIHDVEALVTRLEDYQDESGNESGDQLDEEDEEGSETPAMVEDGGEDK